MLSFVIVFMILIAGGFASISAGKLTMTAGIIAVLTGTAVYIGGGYAGLIELFAFFTMATLATRHKKEEKASLAKQKNHEEKRNAGQVLANGGIAALLGLLAYFLPVHQTLLTIMLAGSIAAATADTLASELGIIYGRNQFNILTLKREAKGLDGVISLEGILLGAAGSSIIALIYAIANGFEISFLVIIVAGTVGNLADSVLGASLERRHYLTNNLVNAANTFIAALFTLLGMLLSS